MTIRIIYRKIIVAIAFEVRNFIPVPVFMLDDSIRYLFGVKRTVLMLLQIPFKMNVLACQIAVPLPKLLRHSVAKVCRLDGNGYGGKLLFEFCKPQGLQRL